MKRNLLGAILIGTLTLVGGIWGYVTATRIIRSVDEPAPETLAVAEVESVFRSHGLPVHVIDIRYVNRDFMATIVTASAVGVEASAGRSCEGDIRQLDGLAFEQRTHSFGLLRWKPVASDGSWSEPS